LDSSEQECDAILSHRGQNSFHLALRILGTCYFRMEKSVNTACQGSLLEAWEGRACERHFQIRPSAFCKLFLINADLLLFLFNKYHEER